MSPGSRHLIARRATALVETALSDTPVVVVQGARQVGKSTLVRQVVATRDEIVSLDVAAQREAAADDPDAFVRRDPSQILVIDEVQRVPELLLAVKAAVDDDRRPGRFLLTGSADLVTLRRGGDSLAGRAETVALYGLSAGEVSGGSDGLVDVLFAGDEYRLPDDRSPLTRRDYLDMACAGSFPEGRARTGRRREAWFDNYLQRIVTRDARDLVTSAGVDRLPVMVEVLAANNSGEFVRARVATDTGIPEATVPAYLDLLVDMFIVHRLPPWGRNLTSRVVGRPKVALLDTGLAAHLANLSPPAMEDGPDAGHAGALLEAFVAAEIRKQQTWSGRNFRLFHYRDRNGLEVDLVLEDTARNVVGIEVKATGRVRPADRRGLEFLRSALGPRFRMGVVLYTGPSAIRLGERLWALPIEALWR